MKLIAVILAMFISINSLAYKRGDVVQLGTENTCIACQEAKDELNKNNIPFTEIEPTQDSDFIPQLYVNGKYMGSGVESVEEYIHNR